MRAEFCGEAVGIDLTRRTGSCASRDPRPVNQVWVAQAADFSAPIPRSRGLDFRPKSCYGRCRCNFFSARPERQVVESLEFDLLSAYSSRCPLIPHVAWEHCGFRATGCGTMRTHFNARSNEMARKRPSLELATVRRAVNEPSTRRFAADCPKRKDKRYGVRL
jgi:hypothetical protein